MTPWPGPTHPTGPAGPSPEPHGPKPSSPHVPKPPPSSPKGSDDEIFLAVALLRVDLARPSKGRPPSRPPKKPINTKPIRGAEADDSLCGHCGRPASGYASALGARLCHPNEGRDCYRLVTVYSHPVPCELCAEPRFSLPQPEPFRVGAL